MDNSSEAIEERIQDALEELSQSEHPKVAVAARNHAVPYQRLLARWKGRPSKLGQPGNNKRLSIEQELALCEYLDRLDEMGTPARIPMIESGANSILRRMHPDDQPGPPPTVGKRWAERFLERHPIRRRGALGVKRTKAHNPDEIMAWFTQFKKTVDEKEIQPEDIWNFDETTFRIGNGLSRRMVILPCKLKQPGECYPC